MIADKNNIAFLHYPKDVERCASIVLQGGVIVFPTDTVYGIGCNPYIDSAVRRIFKIKGRQGDKPLPVLCASIQDAENLVDLHQRKEVLKLAKKFWPGALTLVAPIIASRDDNDNHADDVPKRISSLVLGGKCSLAVRVPSNRCVLGILSMCKYLVGTSANLSGKPSAKTAGEVVLTGYDAIIVDDSTDVGFGVSSANGVSSYGQEFSHSDVASGVASTIVDVTGVPRIIRQGAISSKEIEEALLEDE